MFETAEVGRKVTKEQYQEALPGLRSRLLKAQFAVQDAASFPVIIVIGGVAGAGRGELVNKLQEWLDVRGIEAHAFGRLTDRAHSHPDFWRYWRALPAKGRIGMYFGSWYTDLILDRTAGKMKTGRFDQQLARIERFERALADDGALIVKFWLHLSKDAQLAALKKLEKRSERWRMMGRYWAQHKRYAKLTSVAGKVIRETDSAFSPWFLIEAQDSRYVQLTVGQTVAEAMERRLELRNGHQTPELSLTPQQSTPPVESANVTVLDHVDLTKTITRKRYDQEVTELQGRLRTLAWEAYEKRISTVLVMEGWDAAGKGGTIRRLVPALDARLVRVIAISAPTDEEKAHHYLWRFWRQVPDAGRITIYDRSWYGRVLVERVEGYADQHEWSRAYGEINDFEEQLTDQGIVLLKFFLHLDKDEQLRRFREREVTPYKKHKITPEDWRNREKWDQYESAINDMVARTSAGYAPWHLVPFNDKHYGRLVILRTCCQGLERALARTQRKQKRKM